MANDRTFVRKSAEALPLVLAMVFTFVLYAVLDLVMVNQQTFAFGLTDILGPTLVIAAFSAAILYLSLMLLPGTVFDGVLSLLLGLLLAGYLQGTFLNLHLGQLNGEVIHWELYPGHAAWNLALWVALLLLMLALRYLAPKLWRGLTLFLPLLLIGMQGVALVSSLSQYEFAEKPAERAMLTQQGMLELSTQDNILVFCVDRLDVDFVADLLERNPAFFDDLDGFTYYPNHTSMYSRTYPAVTYMLTGALTHLDEAPEAYFTRAWAADTMLPMLREEGYTTKMFASELYVTGDPAKLVGLLDNVEAGQRYFDTGGLMGPLMRLAAYRNAPHALKASLWMDSTVFADYESYTFSGAEKFREDRDDEFYTQLTEQGLTVQDETYNYAYYHLSGTHGPFYLNEWTERLPETSLYDQMRGEFNLIYTFLDMMKELDVYEESTIIILADHGTYVDGTKPLDEAIAAALFIKPWGSAGEMMQVSEAPVSHDNLRASIMDAAMLDYTSYGIPYAQVEEDAQISRKYLFQVGSESQDYFEEFEINGDARDFSNWTRVRECLIGKDSYM